MSGLTYGSLFSGYEGIGLALEDVWPGIRPAWFSEVDAAPSRILAHHWPTVPNLGDVTKIRWEDVPPVDIITGGSPCQDLSHAGKRAGMKAGTRSGLWASMCDAIDIIRPALVVWENVRGALSAEADSAVEPCPICVGDRPGVTLRALGRVLGDLAELGYDAGWYGLRAADVGAPHGRFRVFVVAWPHADAAGNGRDEGRTQPARVIRGPHAPERGDGACPTCGDPVEYHDEGGFCAGSCGGTCADAELGRPVTWGSREWRDLTLLPFPRTSDTNGAGVHGQGGMDLRTAVSLLPTPAVNDMGRAYTPETWDAWTERMKAAHGNGNGHGASLHIEALRMLPTPTSRDHKGPNQRGDDTCLTGALLPTPSVADVEGGRKHRSGERSGELLLNGIAHAQAFGQYAPAIARWEAALGRPAPAPTEPTGRDGAHRLSPAFVEHMMGLPAGWVTGAPGITRNEALKALGNGVVPQQCAAAVRHLLGVRDATEAVAS